MPAKTVKPNVNVTERFADNGEHSHWEVIDLRTGIVLWSEEQPSQQEDKPITDHDLLNLAQKWVKESHYQDANATSFAAGYRVGSKSNFESHQKPGVSVEQFIEELWNKHRKEESGKSLAYSYTFCIKAVKEYAASLFQVKTDSEMLFHECPSCNIRCNCSDQPCSCCDPELDEAIERENSRQGIELPSDEEIERCSCPDLETERAGWKRGAKWMRDYIDKQLNSKP